MWGSRSRSITASTEHRLSMGRPARRAAPTHSFPSARPDARTVSAKTRLCVSPSAVHFPSYQTTVCYANSRSGPERTRDNTSSQTIRTHETRHRVAKGAGCGGRTAWLKSSRAPPQAIACAATSLPEPQFLSGKAWRQHTSAVAAEIRQCSRADGPGADT